MSHRSSSRSGPLSSSPANPSSGGPGQADSHWPVESVRDIIARLGTPPRDVVEAWCLQVQAIANDIQTRSGEPLPPIDLRSWWVDTRGAVGLRSSGYQARDANLTPDSDQDAIAINDQRVRDFRDQVLQAHVAHPQDQNQPAPAAMTEATLSIDANVTPESETHARKTLSCKHPKALVLITAALVIITGLGSLWWYLGRNTTGVDARGGTLSMTPKRPQPERFSNEETSRSQPPPTSATFDTGTSFEGDGKSLKLESFGSSSNTANEHRADAPWMDAKPSPESDSMKPKSSDPSADAPVREDDFLETSSIVRPEQTTESNGIETTAHEERINANENELPESPQIVRTMQIQSIQLPPTDDTQTAPKIDSLSLNPHPSGVGIPTENLTLEFPLDIPIAMDANDGVGEHHSEGFTIRDTRNEIAIASLTRQSNSFTFTWSERAKASSQAGALLNGRLRDARGNMTYLRPQVEADPWTLSFDEFDFHPSWELSGGLPANVSRLAIDFELPDEVEQAWIAPFDPASPRRTTGVAVLSLRDRETVQIGIHFEVKCTTKLSCRMRIAGRLDPTFAWQTFTSAGLADFANQLLTQADQLQNKPFKSKRCMTAPTPIPDV